MASAFVKLNSAVVDGRLGHTGDFFSFRVVSFSSVARRVWRQPRGLLFRRERRVQTTKSLRSIEKAIVQILFDSLHQGRFVVLI